MAKTVPVRELRSKLEALEETAEVLSDPDALSALEAGLAEIERGKTVAFGELREELADRRPAASWSLARLVLARSISYRSDPR